MLIRGLDNIAEFLGISRSTVVRWRTYHGFPLFRLPNGDVAVLLSQIEAWADTRREISRLTGLDKCRSRPEFINLQRRFKKELLEDIDKIKLND